EADVVLDTSDLALRELRERLFARLGDVEPDRIAIQLISFGFKFGVPLEADLVFDARFLRNPYYVPELRERSGLTEPVREFVMAQPATATFLDLLRQLLAFSIPAFVDEGKSRLTIAIGCTGGQHRSIVLSEELATWLRAEDFGPVAIFHRELERR
ncbi:MAG: RNase adapter RapZ, partial [Chloroflexota bacterium]